MSLDDAHSMIRSSDLEGLELTITLLATSQSVEGSSFYREITDRLVRSSHRLVQAKIDACVQAYPALGAVWSPRHRHP